LAISLRADLLPRDDRKGVIVGRSKRLRVTGTLGVLDIAAERGLVDFAQVINRPRRTTLRLSRGFSILFCRRARPMIEAKQSEMVR